MSTSVKLHNDEGHRTIGRKSDGTRVHVHDKNGDPRCRNRVEIRDQHEHEISPGVWVKQQPQTKVAKGAHLPRGVEAHVKKGVGVTATDVSVHPSPAAAQARPSTQGNDTRVQVHGILTDEEIQALRERRQPVTPVEVVATLIDEQSKTRVEIHAPGAEPVQPVPAPVIETKVSVHTKQTSVAETAPAPAPHLETILEDAPTAA